MLAQIPQNNEEPGQEAHLYFHNINILNFKKKKKLEKLGVQNHSPWHNKEM